MLEEYAKSADVVAMFVGEQNAVERGGVDTDEAEAVGELLGGESGVDEQAEAIAFDKCRIAAATAA